MRWIFPRARLRKSGRRGAALVLISVLCLALIPMLGLAIDGSAAYLVRARMSSALDAAALAGARSLNVGLDIASQAGSATAIAQKVFNADVADMAGQMINIASSVSVGQDDATHYRWVTVTASADLPLTMMAVLGHNTTHIGMTATAHRRDVNIVLVLDHSGSMAAAMPAMREAATAFTDLFAGGRDHVGLVVYTGSTFLAYPASVNFKSASPNMTTLISQLTSNNGATNTAQAMWTAYGELLRLNQPGALNVIVLFTDGLANTYTANFQSLISAANSGCTGLAAPLRGVILAFTGGSLISGISDPTANTLNDITENRAAPNSAGCFWNTNTLNNGKNLPTALTSLPSTDINGNSTNGAGSIGAYLPVNLTAAGFATATSANLNVTNSGQNAFDDAANRIRGDVALKPLIYAIGLGGNPGMPPDNVLMARIANDPSSPSFNAAQNAGLYLFSPTTAELHSAFIRIASAVLRLAQ